MEQNHPGYIIQNEVLLEEGYYKQLGPPQDYYENGVKKIEIVDDQQILWKIVELEETGIPIR